MSIEVKPDWWKRLFDEVYLVTDARSVCDDDLTAREVELICRLIPILPGHNVLDLCGGHGRHCLELCRRGFTHCTVFDFSQALLAIGARRAAQANLPVAFVQGDARNVDLPSARWHHVLILGNSLGYARDQGSDLQILCEAHRLLAAGGWLLLDVADGSAVQTHFNPKAWHEIGDEMVVCRRRELRPGVIHAREMVLSKVTGLVRDQTYAIRFYTSKDLIRLVSEAGFSNVHLRRNFSSNGDDEDYGFMNHRMIVTARKP
jgi:D-alanine-D-alanine ligase